MLNACSTGQGRVRPESTDETSYFSILRSPRPRGRSMTSDNRTLVVQPLPGIGDMIWHLPHLHALASDSRDGKVSVLTKPRSRADLLLRADPTIDQVIWLERNPGKHDSPLGFLRLVRLLRSGNYERVWILHDSSRYHWAALFAGIPQRFGYGKGLQRFLQNSGVRLPKVAPHHPIAKADLLLDLHALPRTESEPKLHADPQLLETVARRYAHVPRPWMAFGIGSSEVWKQWGQERFAELARTLRENHDLSILVIGGPAETVMAEWIVEQAGSVGNRVYSAANLPIDETAALLSHCALYVGNDTGFLNMAAALGVHSFGLFGGSPPLRHSEHIHVILADHGRESGYGGNDMADISVAAVSQRVHAFLAAQAESPGTSPGAP